MQLTDLRCPCGSSDIQAVAPGDEPERVGDLFPITSGEPMRVWCAQCWERAFAARVLVRTPTNA